MAKGSIPFSHDHCLGAVGLAATDYISCGFNQADLVVCVGYDIVEYHPHLWNQFKTAKILHIDFSPAEVDEYYIVECGVIGDIARALTAIADLATPKDHFPATSLRQTIINETQEHADDTVTRLSHRKSCGI